VPPRKQHIALRKIEVGKDPKIGAMVLVFKVKKRDTTKNCEKFASRVCCAYKNQKKRFIKQQTFLKPKEIRWWYYRGTEPSRFCVRNST